MAATLGRSGIQPPREGCLDPVITVDILEQRIEEKFSSHAAHSQKAPSGRRANIDARDVARGFAPVGLRSGPEIYQTDLIADVTTATQPNGAVRRSDKLPRHREPPQFRD